VEGQEVVEDPLEMTIMLQAILPEMHLVETLTLPDMRATVIGDQGLPHLPTDKSSL